MSQKLPVMVLNGKKIYLNMIKNSWKNMMKIVIEDIFLKKI